MHIHNINHQKAPKKLTRNTRERIMKRGGKVLKHQNKLYARICSRLGWYTKSRVRVPCVKLWYRCYIGFFSKPMVLLHHKVCELIVGRSTSAFWWVYPYTVYVISVLHAQNSLRYVCGIAIWLQEYGAYIDNSCSKSVQVGWYIISLYYSPSSGLSSFVCSSS